MSFWLVLGILLTAGLVIMRVKGAILIRGLLAITFAGMLFENPATGATYTQWQGLVSLENPIEALAPTFGQLTFDGLFGGGVAAIIGVLFCHF